MRVPDHATWTPPHWRVLTLVSLFLLVANVFDAYYTREFVGRHAEEVNPLMRFIMARDWTVVWVLKIGVPLALTAACAFVIFHPESPRLWRRLLWYALCLTAAFYALVVANLIYISVRVLLSS